MLKAPTHSCWRFIPRNFERVVAFDETELEVVTDVASCKDCSVDVEFVVRVTILALGRVAIALLNRIKEINKAAAKIKTALISTPCCRVLLLPRKLHPLSDNTILTEIVCGAEFRSYLFDDVEPWSFN